MSMKRESAPTVLGNSLPYIHFIIKSFFGGFSVIHCLILGFSLQYAMRFLSISWTVIEAGRAIEAGTAIEERLKKRRAIEEAGRVIKEAGSD